MEIYRFIDLKPQQPSSTNWVTDGSHQTATTCNYKSVSKLEGYRDLLQAPYESLIASQRATFVSTLDPAWLESQLPDNQSTYFGNATTDNVGLFNPRVYPVSWKDRSRLKARSFAQRVAGGDIVINPYSVGNCKITEIPDMWPQDVINTRTLTVVRQPFDGILLVEQPPCSALYYPWYKSRGADKWRRGSTARNPAGKIIPAFGLLATYRRETYGARALPSYPFDLDPGLRPAIESFIQQLKTLKPVKGLVTEVVCEANSGAWDIYTSVMEGIRETLPMVFHTLKRILELYQSARGKIRHRRKINSGSIKADIAKIWLQYRYAIMPLAYELNDILAFMDSEVNRYESYRKGRTKEVLFSYNGWEASCEVVDRCLVRNRMDFSRFANLQMNLPNTGWQLMPLSFIVDWAFNVGDVLSASIAPNGLDLQRVCYSSRVNTSMHLKHPEKPGSVIVELDLYTRSLLDKWLYIDLEFAPSLNFKRSIDAWAIFWAGIKNPTRYR